MTLAFASRLPTANEYFVASWGQSNNNPKGLRSEAMVEGTQVVQVNGFDLVVVDIAGTTVTFSGPAQATNSLVGMELRIMRPFYGQSLCPARAGKGLVTANSGNTLTVTWDVVGSIPPFNATGFSFASGSKVSYTAHPYQNGDGISFGGGPTPAELSVGVTYYVTGAAANDFQLSATYGGSPITFSTASSGAACFPAIGVYLHWPDGRGLAHSNVRVLTPYLPEAPGAYPSGAPRVPNRSFPASVIGYEQAAALLDFTWNEGVDGYGVSNSGGTVTYTATAVVDSSLALATDILKGATVQVPGTGNLALVTSNTSTQINVASWPGGQPANGSEYEVSVPHYRDNPHNRTVGFGFRAPSNHHQPGFLGTGFVYNRARGRLSPSYVPVSGTGMAAVQAHRMGQMFEMGYRLSARLGRRVNIVHVAADASSLLRSTLRGGSPATIGWWTTGTFLDWVPEAGDNLAARLRNLIVTATPAALLAEGNTKPAKFLGEVAFQGESETLTSGRFIYSTLLSAVHGWLRAVIHGAGLSYYPNAQDLPVVHAGLGSTWQTLDTLNGGYVQTAIDDWTALDPAADTFSTAAEPVQIADPAHFNGLGELHNGDNAAETLAGLVDDYVSQAVDDNAVEVANMALSFVGETTRVFSLDTRVDTSAQAAECAKFFGPACNELLETYSWSFATRTDALVAVTKDAIRTDWTYAYALPVNLAVPLEVLPPGQTTLDDSVNTEVVPYWRAPGTQTRAAPNGYKFAVERNANGQQVLYTHVADAVLRYCVRVSAATQWPMKFKVALARKLASFLAGPFVKGDGGLTLAAKFDALADAKAGSAAASDANRFENRPPDQEMPWNR